MTIKHVRKKSKNNNNKLYQLFWSSLLRRVALLENIFFIFIIAWLAILCKDLPSFTQLEKYEPDLATKVYSADDKLLTEFFTERRVFIPLSNIPTLVQNAVLDTEDHRFFDHWGIVPIRLIKVVFTDLLTMSKQQGGSTLTQQLARRLYLTPEKTITRKLKEIITAIQLERTYTKSEILEMYMNHMQFGHGTYGVEAASQRFFNKTVRQLDYKECALIAGMLQRPGYLNPFRYPERAAKRRNVVLSRMLSEEHITKDEYNEGIQSDLNLASKTENPTTEFAAYFVEDVRRKLDKKFGRDLYTGGMKIYTTLDSRVQACAETAVATFLPKVQAVVNRHMRRKNEFARLVPPSHLQKRTLDQLLADKTYVDSLINKKAAVQVALVCLDPRNGHVKAMIGGRSFLESQFNRAVQARRQPGSVFKPIVYTAAVDNGYMPCYEKLNQPIVVHMPDGSRWTPHNYGESIGGKTTLREGLRRSLNLITARLIQEDIPPEQVVKYARNLGITTPLEAVDAIGLGAIGVIPMEIISAFGVFPNKGVLVRPVSVLRVADKFDNILETSSPESKGVLREETAYIIANMLQTVASRGTGATSRSVYKFLRPAGGKTGTTNDFTDAWYVTFTPQLVSGVWVGLDDPSLSLGKRQSGAIAALPINATFMKAAHDTLGLPVEDFVRPQGVVELDICSETKQLATDFCPDVITEIFDVRYQPKGVCQQHTGERSRNQKMTNQHRPKKKIRY